MGQRTFLKRHFVSMNFSPKLLRNGNIFAIFVLNFAVIGRYTINIPEIFQVFTIFLARL